MEIQINEENNIFKQDNCIIQIMNIKNSNNLYVETFKCFDRIRNKSRGYGSGKRLMMNALIYMKSKNPTLETVLLYPVSKLEYDVKTKIYEDEVDKYCILPENVRIKNYFMDSTETDIIKWVEYHCPDHGVLNRIINDKIDVYILEQQQNLINYYKSIGFEGDKTMSGNIDHIITTIRGMNGGRKSKRIRKSKRKTNKMKK